VGEWRNLEWARAAGLAVPEGVAVGEFIGPWGRLQGFLAVRELTGMLPLHQAIPAAAEALPPRAFARWKRGLVAEIARMARELHGRRRYHKDLYLCHFFAPAGLIHAGRPEWRGRLHLIDLHRLAHHRSAWRFYHQIKDLAQLLFSSDVAGVTARDRLRFWRLYRGPEGRRRPRLLERLILLKWSRYRKHNDKAAARAGRQPPTRREASA
jgi:heptose I phosphotransferase